MNNTVQYSSEYTIEVTFEIYDKKIWTPFRGFVSDFWNISPFTYESLDDVMQDIKNYNLKDWRIYKHTYTKELMRASNDGDI